MIDLRFRPLPKWTEPTLLEFRRAQFKTPWNRTLDLMEHELNKLDASDILVEAGFKLADIRNDGWPRGSASASHPGIVLYFKSPQGELRFPCGTFEGWGNNFHAIALTLEHLRAVDRFGVTVGRQQYMGFKAIAAPAPAVSVAEAARLVAVFSQAPDKEAARFILSDYELFRTAYRVAAGKVHPDVAGGSVEKFQTLSEAKRVLEEHHRARTAAA